MSVDLECPDNQRQDKMSHTYNLRSRDARYRTVSECVGPSTGLFAAHPFPTSIRPFPIQELPRELMIKIFSYLSPTELGTALRVCPNWYTLVKDSSLWTSVDFTAMPVCYADHPGVGCTRLCYTSYKHRVKSFMRFLDSIRPILRRLRLAFDIGDREDNWLSALDGFLTSAQLHELDVLYLTWHETPAKPYFGGVNLTWTTSDTKELMQKQRYRQRLFVNMFTHLSERCSSVTKLCLPFEWSARTLQALGRLQRLDSLMLEKYFMYQPLAQESLDLLFHSLPKLRQLTLEVWTPSGPGLQLYSMAAAQLVYLDISQCRGVFLKSMSAPRLEVFKLSRHPFSGPLITSPDALHIPCVYDVIRDGCPALKQINEHILSRDWRYMGVYAELQVVLAAVCACHNHRTTDSWAM